MKISRQQVQSNTSAIPEITADQDKLTSHAGLVIFQQLVATLDLKAQLARCFRDTQKGAAYRGGRMFLLLILHLLLGFRHLNDIIFYKDDPLVKHCLGQKQLPAAATISRFLGDVTDGSLEQVAALNEKLVCDRLTQEGLKRITLDFDGSVQSTKRHAEGTAVGYNRKKKGDRSYYPLFCTVAQTGQVLAVLHRSGNVHDSKGACDFVRENIARVRKDCPNAVIEVRLDGAFFSDTMVELLRQQQVEFTISVPFERFVSLKQQIEDRTWWYQVNPRQWAFEMQWKPQCWKHRHRFVFICTERQVQRKGPLQLDLFEPVDTDYDYKVVVTNKSVSYDRIVAFHEGRGAQENIFGRLKSQCHAGHVPVNGRNGNRMYLYAGIMSHNMLHEMQMRLKPRRHDTTPSRAALWEFEQAQTFRNHWLNRGGRLTRPKNRLTLTIAGAQWVANELRKMIRTIAQSRRAS